MFLLGLWEVFSLSGVESCFVCVYLKKALLENSLVFALPVWIILFFWYWQGSSPFFYYWLYKLSVRCVLLDNLKRLYIKLSTWFGLLLHLNEDFSMELELQFGIVSLIFLFWLVCEDSVYLITLILIGLRLLRGVFHEWNILLWLFTMITKRHRNSFGLRCFEAVWITEQ